VQNKFKLIIAVVLSVGTLVQGAPRTRFVLDLDDMMISSDVRKFTDEQQWPLESLGLLYRPPANGKLYRYLPGALAFPFFLRSLRFNNSISDVGVFSSYGNGDRTREIVAHAWGTSPSSVLSYVMAIEQITRLDSDDPKLNPFAGKTSRTKKDLSTIPDFLASDQVLLIEDSLRHSLPNQWRNVVYLGPKPDRNLQLFWVAGLLLEAKGVTDATHQDPVTVLSNWQWIEGADGKIEWQKPPFEDAHLIRRGAEALSQAAGDHLSKSPLCPISIYEASRGVK